MVTAVLVSVIVVGSRQGPEWNVESAFLYTLQASMTSTSLSDGSQDREKRFCNDLTVIWMMKGLLDH